MCSSDLLWFDTTAAAAGKVLWNTVSGFGVSIEPGCNGIEACIVLFAAIMAYPASWRHRLMGIVAGFAAVQGVNVLRVISLFYLGQWRTDVFNFAHEYLWQGLIMLDVLVVWLLWVRVVVRSRPEESDPPEQPPAPPVLPVAPRGNPGKGVVSSSLDLSPR